MDVVAVIRIGDDLLRVSSSAQVLQKAYHPALDVLLVLLFATFWTLLAIGIVLGTTSA